MKHARIEIRDLRACGNGYEWTIRNALGIPIERWLIPAYWVYKRFDGETCWYEIRKP